MRPSIRGQAEQFALDIMETLAGVIPQGDLGMDLTAVEAGEEHFALTCNELRGIELQVDEKTVMRFEIDFLFSPDSSGTWLKVRRSAFALVPEDSGTPFFRYDYLSDATNAPSAHINVHAHRDDLIAALVGSGRGQMAKNRRKKFIDRGVLPRLANFHFPVGGNRFRPCLEDVLEAAINEFGLDRKSGFQKVLDAGRTRYQARQLKAAVRDQPELAIEALEALGYDVQNALGPTTA